MDKNKKAIEIYDYIAEEYAKRFDAIVSDEDLKFLNIFLSHLKPGSHIVDLGCGTGFSSGYFAKKGMKTQGVDLSSNMISIAKRNYSEINFSIADMREFMPEEKVDAVWAGYSLFHFEKIHLEKTLESIKSYLRPQGILGIVMQGGNGEVEITEPFMPSEKIYIRLYTQEELIKLLQQYGFEIIDQNVKKAADYEFPYDKILLIAKFQS
ncbi:MAG: Methyltransferase type 11 [Candidatus Jorgensenbacteria bacterium GW2011_GWA1_48_11]|uniref:Methyltransferase type 11 n=1 Tax=Candidatus Jorgensenbacteria bacterium GW2011_GWA1_48_11 TaxID=1618660 RepID=A0A0G1X9A0_9BACT|nr:MAG: Methyltransferase type 11 [Candidatus Jorgensenbacteria bacterium GW2011_GWA1_48_11]KKW12339.1 MAG: Methyltransferase type 11 [Candidatus Jorgensenbacteria bacterium GW2011_GWB1_49_9]